jgi:DNA-binding CsgD family transcriptional regulator
VLDDLDCCGYLCAMTGRRAEAVTVWVAVVALQGREGFSVPSHPDLPEGWFERQEPLREARQALGPDQTRAAEERGQAMSLATAAEYALMLTAAGPQPPAAAPGPEGLSPRERELVTLVAQGHTDAQIADQLYISVRTVSSHLDRIRDKTGCRRRADLTRLALSAGLVLRSLVLRSLVLRSLSGRAAARHAAVWVIPPRPWPHGKRGETTSAADLAGRANLWLRAGEPASFRADRTRQCPHNLPTREFRPGRHSRPPWPAADGSGERATGSA